MMLGTLSCSSDNSGSTPNNYGGTTIALPKLFGDNMVLQQRAKVNVWGTARAQTTVKLTGSWDNKTYTTRSDKSGKWSLQVDTPAASFTRYTIKIDDGTVLELKNVLIGEVWMCSGQSNMEMNLGSNSATYYVEGGQQALAEVDNYPDIRLFTVVHKGSSQPADELNSWAGWVRADKTHLAPFSAIAYFFARELNKRTNYPIGIINTAWSSAVIQAYMSAKSIDDIPNIDHQSLEVSNEQPQFSTGQLFNGMIYPARNYTIKGFIWYQGEGNQGCTCYDKLMAAMVKLWRTSWGNDRMPFYYVQLAPYNDTNIYTVELQYKALDEIPYSGIACTTDVGNATMLHPPKKQPVGERLAWLALRNDYGVTDGIPLPTPLLKGMTLSGGSARISFKNIAAPNNIFAANDAIVGFEIAGADRTFHAATATLSDGNTTVTVSSPDVPTPVAVRYAFKSFTNSNLMTTAGQAVAPFRTDTW